MKTKKVYRVTIGLQMKGEGNNEQDADNWSAETLVAVDVPAAIKQLKLKKNEYVSSVELLQVLTK